MRRSLVLLSLAAVVLFGCDARRQGSPAESETPRARIDVGPGKKILAVVEADLDSDPGVEEVIAVKDISDISSAVMIVVADPDPVKGRYYFKTWEGATASVSARVFELTARNLLGNHEMQIVFRGMDAQGKTTLDVFKKLASVDSAHLSFCPIFGIAADGIEILGSERLKSEANGESVAIAAYSEDTASRDIIRTVYAWDAAGSRYIPGDPERGLREKLDKKRLEALFGDPDTGHFERFMDGSWILSAGSEIFTIDAGSRRICRCLGDTEEIYDWDDSLRVAGNCLIARCKNIDVHTITRTFTMRVLSMDTIEISISGTDLGEPSPGTFIRARIGADSRAVFGALPAAAPPEGPYTSSSGDTVLFSGAHVNWSDRRKTSQGSFHVFRCTGRNVLSVRFVDGSGISDGVQSYLLETENQKLLLTPITLTVQGYEISSGEQIILQRDGRDSPG